jgi:hypothetical protein
VAEHGRRRGLLETRLHHVPAIGGIMIPQMERRG